METEKTYKLVPTYGNSFGTGFQVMLDNFLRLLLVVFVLAILTAPFTGHELQFDEMIFRNMPTNGVICSGMICINFLLWALSE